MIDIEDIREWRGYSVLDEGGRKVGTLEAIYVDTATDDPSFATITVGLPTQRKLVFVPLAGAKVGPEYLKVAYDKKVIKDAPFIDVDGELPATDEPRVFGHYEIPYKTGATGERRLGRR